MIASVSSCIIITFIAILLVFLLPFPLIHAHIFSSNESASFISLIDEIKSTLNVISKNNSSNAETIIEQIGYSRALLNDTMVEEIQEKNQRLAEELPRAFESIHNLTGDELNSNISRLQDLLSETIDARVEDEQLKNTTIQALAVAENVDKVFAQYISAYNNSVTQFDMNMTMKKNTTPNKEINGEVPNDIQAYYRALELVEIAIDRFNSELKNNSENVSAAQEALGGLEKLRNAINNREPPSNLMGLVHGQIHPNLQKAFELQLAI